MNCRESREAVIEIARTRGALPPPDLAAHLEDCEECARSFDAQRALQVALASMAAESIEPMQEEVLERAVTAQWNVSRRPVRLWVPVWAGAVAVSVAIGVFLLRAPAAAPEQPFLRIPYVAPPAPYERTEVRRMDVPIAALITAGLEVHVPDAGAVVPADILLGQDGRALAIRLLSKGK